MNDLTTLNDNLFEVFDLVKQGRMDLKQAQVLNSTASNIIKNTKAQLDALKLADRTGYVMQTAAPALQKLTAAIPEQRKKLRLSKFDNFNKQEILQKKEQFARSLGYDSRLSAVVALTEKVFDQKFHASISTAS